MNAIKLASLYCFAILITGCVSSKVSTIQNVNRPNHKVETIALAPGGGVLADAVGVELSNRGFDIIDSAQTSNLMVRYNLSELEVSRPAGLAKLKEQGIDAYLSVKTVGGDDLNPQSASARVNSTFTGKIITGVTWENGRGGREGSIADRTMRKGLNGAAIEIADALSKSLQTVQ